MQAIKSDEYYDSNSFTANYDQQMHMYKSLEEIRKEFAYREEKKAERDARRANDRRRSERQNPPSPRQKAPGNTIRTRGLYVAIAAEGAHYLAFGSSGTVQALLGNHAPRKALSLLQEEHNERLAATYETHTQHDGAVTLLSFTLESAVRTTSYTGRILKDGRELGLWVLDTGTRTSHEESYYHIEP